MKKILVIIVVIIVLAAGYYFSVGKNVPSDDQENPAFLQAIIDGGEIDTISKFSYKGKTYYSAADIAKTMLDGPYQVYSSNGTLVDQCGMMPKEGVCEASRTETEIIYKRN